MGCFLCVFFYYYLFVFPFLAHMLSCERQAEMDTIKRSSDRRGGLQGKENPVFNSFKSLRSASNRESGEPSPIGSDEEVTQAG